MRNWFMRQWRVRSPTSGLLKLETQESIDVIQSESVVLRTKGANDTNPSPRARESETRCSKSISEAGKKEEFLLSLTFVLYPDTRERPAYQFKCYPHLEAPSQIYPETMFNLDIYDPAKLSIKLIIIKGKDSKFQKLN